MESGRVYYTSSKTMIKSFDIDGVIFNGEGYPVLKPSFEDIIITGRSFEESIETKAFLKDHGILNEIFYNMRKFSEKSRETSGLHKATILCSRPDVIIHYEDDPVQAGIINEHWTGTIILLNNPLVEFENKRHYHHGI
jgi:hypothetical protein